MNTALIRPLTLLMLLLLAPLAAQAQNSQDFGNYVVYYNAFTTDFLQPAIAKTYGITRSKHRAMVNLSIQKKVMGTSGEPVTAKIEGVAANLTGQLKTLTLREIRDGNAIYYIGEFPVANLETLDFTLRVKPVGSSQHFSVKFRQQFYTD